MRHLMRHTVFAGLAASLVGVSLVSSALAAPGCLDGRRKIQEASALRYQARQEARIERGLARGEFTRREARSLRQGQREIARVEARAKADGHVSRYEIRNLIALLDQADAQIREFRHDRDGHRPV